MQSWASGVQLGLSTYPSLSNSVYKPGSIERLSNQVLFSPTCLVQLEGTSGFEQVSLQMASTTGLCLMNKGLGSSVTGSEGEWGVSSPTCPVGETSGHRRHCPVPAHHSILMRDPWNIDSPGRPMGAPASRSHWATSQAVMEEPRDVNCTVPISETMTTTG